MLDHPYVYLVAAIICLYWAMILHLPDDIMMPEEDRD